MTLQKTNTFDESSSLLNRAFSKTNDCLQNIVCTGFTKLIIRFKLLRILLACLYVNAKDSNFYLGNKYVSCALGSSSSNLQERKGGFLFKNH